MTTPTSAIGHASSGGVDSRAGWWSQIEDEHVPELRWPLNVAVYDRMRKSDAQVMSVLRAVTMPIRRTTWRLDPNGSRPEVFGPLAEDLGLEVVGVDLQPGRRTKDRFSWPEHLRLALLQLVYGHMFFEQEYRYDGSLFRLRKLGPRLPRTLAAVNVARDGGLVSIEQHGTKRPIPVDRLVAYVHEREGGNWLGQSLLRSAWKAWVLKDPTLKTWVQTIDRNGMGVWVYTGSEEEQDLTKGLAIATGIRSGSNAGAALPNGATLEGKGVTGELPDAEPLVRYLDEQIARAVLAHVLNLGTQTGSWALGSVLADVLTQSLQGFAETIADTATQHIVEDWVDVNFGADEPAPRIVFEAIGSQQAATAQALKMLVDAGVIFPDRALEEAVRQQNGLPPKSTPAPSAATA